MDRTYPQQLKSAEFFSTLSTVTKSGATFDSAEVANELQDAPASVEALSEVVQDYDINGKRFSGKEAIIKATMDGIEQYKKLHGRAPGGDVIENALNSTVGSLVPSKVGLDRVVLDDVSSSGSGAPMQANRAVIAIYQSIVDAFPCGGYIPMTDGMQGKIIIAKHEAGNNCGSYLAGQNMDGTKVGQEFMSSGRTVEASNDGSGNFTALIKHAANDVNGSPVIPGSTKVLVNGIPAGGVALSNGNNVTTAPISGQITIAGTNHALTGSLTVVTGEAKFKFEPALPVGTYVEAIGHINFEHANNKDKRPQVQASAYTYDFRANYMSGLYRITQEAKVQFAAEMRIDGGTEAMYQLRVQSGAERHREALKRMYSVGRAFVQTFDMKAITRQDERSRVTMWEDIRFPIAAVDQAMVERTQGFGVDCIYVGGIAKSEMESLPPYLFESSGLPSRAGIYRIGRLYGRYNIYYVPNMLNETQSAVEMLLIGRSEQVARNPILMGDVAGANIIPLAANNDLGEGYGYFQALATEVNPHYESAVGSALLEITGMKG